MKLVSTKSAEIKGAKRHTCEGGSMFVIVFTVEMVEIADRAEMVCRSLT